MIIQVQDTSKLTETEKELLTHYKDELYMVHCDECKKQFSIKENKGRALKKEKQFCDHECAQIDRTNEDTKAKINAASERNFLKQTDGKYTNPSQIPEIKQKKLDTRQGK